MKTRECGAKRFIIAGIFMLCAASPLFAPPQEAHNSDLTRVLFGVPFVQFPEHEANLSLLEQAAYLTVDQYNGHNLFYLDNLRNAGVKNLPQGAEIDFTAGSEHQRYTHRGWDFNTYPVNHRGYNFQQIWEMRKITLLSTVSAVFKFKRDEQIKIESFAALIYYTHILGDHGGDSKSTYRDRIPIFQRPDYRNNRSGPQQLNPTICTELLYHIPRLFREQTETTEYKMLLLYLQRSKLTVLPSVLPFTDEEYMQYQNAAREMIDKLSFFIPQLLSKESFFQSAFPPNTA
ncbi:MAG: hypothetical protein Pg6C_14210 [Treponemataceae bacterium]|nr:MAG: hypothetical protein Pg6C_14210 [Treponemataceae bacterium]